MKMKNQTAKLKNKELIKIACQVLDIEAEAVAEQKKHLDKNFLEAIAFISACQGRIVFVGVGKSGLIARKIAATFSSTGTPALYLHPGEGIHGDIGMITAEDLVVTLSYSGETEEIKKILPAIKRMSIKMIAITANLRSQLAQKSDIVINVQIKREACPYNLAPTASTTAMLAMGDALAVALLKEKGFKAEDFARLHPGGILGKILLLTVQEIMHKGKDNPVVSEDKTVREAILEMTRTRLGATNVVNKQGKLVGFFTDGDLRRKLANEENILEKKINQVMSRKPCTISFQKLAIEALKMMQERKFDNIPVVDNQNRPIGIIDERDLLAEGLK